MRPEASILHLDLDAFFASVEQRDKPSLRGKPVVVGGTGPRGVVATASYEARAFGVRSAMPAGEARRRCPHAAFLSGRFGAYREASARVLQVLRELSPLVEPLSLDEAYVDLRAATPPVQPTRVELTAVATELRARVSARTGGLTASVGVASSKLLAKIASDLAKPDGLWVVDPGTEAGLLRTLPVAVIPGVGPVTRERLGRLGVRTVADLQAAAVEDLAQVVHRSSAAALVELAFGRDDRPVEPERETKSISAEDTFETDVVDSVALRAVVDAHARQVAARLRAAGLFARTVTLKVRLHDFSTHTRSKTVRGATDSERQIVDLAQGLLPGVDTTGGVRLLGVGVAGLTDALQEELFDEPDPEPAASPQQPVAARAGVGTAGRTWPPGADVQHARYGAGWVWGSGLGRVTVRFESRTSPPGPVRTFAAEDPELSRVG